MHVRMCQTRINTYACAHSARVSGIGYFRRNRSFLLALYCYLEHGANPQPFIIILYDVTIGHTDPHCTYILIVAIYHLAARYAYYYDRLSLLFIIIFFFMFYVSCPPPIYPSIGFLSASPSSVAVFLFLFLLLSSHHSFIHLFFYLLIALQYGS